MLYVLVASIAAGWLSHPAAETLVLLSLAGFVIGVPSHLAHKQATLSGDADGRDHSWIFSYSTFGKSWFARASVYTQSRHVLIIKSSSPSDISLGS